MTIRDLLPPGIAGPSGEVEIVRVSSIPAADEASLVFATEETSYENALRSHAGAILAPAKLNQAVGTGHSHRVIFVDDPRYVFAFAGKRLASRQLETSVHATAVIGTGVVLGARCRVEAGAVLGDGVTLGNSCVIGPRVTLYAGTRLGSRVVVQAGAVLGSAGFGYARNTKTGSYLLFPQQGRLEIEDDVEIGANTTIDRGALGETRIGAGTKIDNLVHIGHNCVIGKNVIIAAQTGISGSSVVEDGAILGGQVGIGEHATVGAGVILGGGAGVLSGKKMNGAGQVFWGRPARPLKQYLRDLARLRRG